jgi:hypothetical protein
MRKMLAMLMAALLLTVSAAQAAPYSGRGGIMGFIGGCCFGLRAGAAYNDGKMIHWREWGQLIPYVGIVIYFWNGVDCASGMTSADLTAQYGAMYY